MLCSTNDTKCVTLSNDAYDSDDDDDGEEVEEDDDDDDDGDDAVEAEVFNDRTSPNRSSALMKRMSMRTSLLARCSVPEA